MIDTEQVAAYTAADFSDTNDGPRGPLRPPLSRRADGGRRARPGAAPPVRSPRLHSLCAAFTPAELRARLDEHGLPELTVEVVSDRRIVTAGRIQPGSAPG